MSQSVPFTLGDAAATMSSKPDPPSHILSSSTFNSPSSEISNIPKPTTASNLLHLTAAFAMAPSSPPSPEQGFESPSCTFTTPLPGRRRITVIPAAEVDKDNDIMCERGGRSNRFLGNAHFRRLAASLSCCEAKLLVELDEIDSRSPPGVKVKDTSTKKLISVALIEVLAAKGSRFVEPVDASGMPMPRLNTTKNKQGKPGHRRIDEYGRELPPDGNARKIQDKFAIQEDMSFKMEKIRQLMRDFRRKPPKSGTIDLQEHVASADFALKVCLRNPKLVSMTTRNLWKVTSKLARARLAAHQHEIIQHDVEDDRIVEGGLLRYIFNVPSDMMVASAADAFTESLSLGSPKVPRPKSSKQVLFPRDSNSDEERGGPGKKRRKSKDYEDWSDEVDATQLQFSNHSTQNRYGTRIRKNK